jgi:diguanylate cyclase (GGDEF)-like protein
VSVLDDLPDALARAIRTAAVPPYLRVLFARIPARASMEADLPAHVEDVPLAARQLVKLAALGDAFRIARVRASGVALELRFSLGERAAVLTAKDLAGDVRGACTRLVEALYEPPLLAQALARFGTESATQSTLSTLTTQMLRAPDLDHALYAMLSGVTSGFGLGFHRAALFVRGDDPHVFVGSKAIGPADEDDAHRIWEEMEYEGKALEQIVLDYAHGKADNRYESFVRTLALRESDGGADAGAADDEIAAALRATEPLLFTRERPANTSLHTLRPARAFVVAAVARRTSAGAGARALLFADDAWSERPVAPERLARLAVFLDQLGLVWENLALYREVEALARVDALTGVSNRRVFEERLRDEQSRAQRGATPLSILLIDLDDFKTINDTRGHAAGDEALRVLAGLFSHALRAHDTVARIGGDEFAVLLPGIAAAEAVAVARRIGALAKLAGVSLSIGGATYPDDTDDIASVLRLADQALYAAKRGGRARAVLGDTHAPF